MTEWTALTRLRKELSVDRADPDYDAACIALELGDEVRAMREQRGWSQTELADRAGMTKVGHGAI